MKEKDIGKLVIAVAISAVIFWLVKRQSDKTQAAGLLPGAIYPTTESEYEKLHKVGPITKYVKRQIPVYRTIEEWEEDKLLQEIVPLPVPPKEIIKQEIIIGGTPSSAGYQYYPDRDGWMRPWDEASFIPARLAPKWDRFIP